MDDQGCPRCKTTKYRNPSLKLMVNVCGHTLLIAKSNLCNMLQLNAKSSLYSGNLVDDNRDYANLVAEDATIALEGQIEGNTVMNAYWH
ncbi:hypothetical protein STEG23_023062 [Scotinomys teguina]